MAVNSYPSSAPASLNELVFSGSSSTGGYVYGSSLAPGTYTAYVSGGSSTATYRVGAPNSNTYVDIPAGDMGSITVTSTETSFTIGQNTQFTPRTTNFASNIVTITYGNGLWVAGGTSVSQTASAPRYTKRNAFNLITSTDSITWNTRDSKFGYNLSIITSGGFYGIAYGNGTYVYIGYGGLVATSGDGLVLTQRDSILSTTMYAISYGNGLFVAVGFSNSMAASTDGITWTSRDLSAFGTTTLYAVNYVNNRWLAAGDAGYMVTSTDTITWSTVAFPVATSIQTLTYGNGVYVAAGQQNSASGSIATSTDLVTWSTRSIGSAGLGMAASAYGAGLIVVAGQTGYLFTSTDGVTWTSRASSSGSSFIRALGYNGTRFTYVSDVGTVGYSTDAITWTNGGSFTGFGASAIAWGSRFVANQQTSLSPRSGLGQTSTDGITWTSTAQPIGYASIYTSLYANNTYLIAGEAGFLNTSTDGLTWSSRLSNFTTFIRGLAYGNGVYVAVGDSGYLSSSTNGVTWTTRSADWSGTFPATASLLRTVIFDGSKFITGGARGILATSTDGITWVSRMSNNGTVTVTPSGGGYNGATYGPSGYLVAGQSGFASKSTDGITWYPVNVKLGLNNLYAARYLNGIYIVCGTSLQSGISTSTDLITWTTRATTGISSGTGIDISYGNGIYTIVASSMNIFTSTDLVTWTSRVSTFTSADIYATEYGAGVFVAAGAHGQLSTSTDGITWVTRASNSYPGSSASANVTSIAYNGSGTYFMNTPASSAGRWSIMSSSTDGVTWTPNHAFRSAQGTSAGMGKVIYADGRWFGISTIVSNNGFTSTDGILWVSRALNINASLSASAVAYGNNTYVVAGGPSGLAPISTSPDGATWTSRNSVITTTIYALSYQNGLFLAGGEAGQFATSPDGVTWTTRAAGNLLSVTGSIVGIAYGNGLHMVINSVGTVRSSTDTITWVSNQSIGNGPFTHIGNPLIFGKGLFIAGSAGVLKSSTDGVNWTTRLGVTSGLSCLSFDGTTFFADGSFPGYHFVSTDGITWTSRYRNFGAGAIKSIVYGNGLFVAAADHAAVIKSTDGITWVRTEPFGSNTLYGLGYNGNKFILSIPNSAFLLTSTDAITWTNSGTTGVPMAYGGAVVRHTAGVTSNAMLSVGHVPVSITGAFSYSTDGVTWSNQGNAFGWGDLLTIAYGNGIYLAAGSNTLISSTDAITWVTKAAPTSSTYALTYGNGSFYLVANATNTPPRSSTDGNTWTVRSVNLTTAALNGLGYGNGIFVVGGSNGALSSTATPSTLYLYKTTSAGALN